MSKIEKVKLHHYVPAGLISALDRELRMGKDPTLILLSDGITYCLELGVADLAKKNASAEGLYIAELSARTRRMELEEKVREMEYKTNGFKATELGLKGSVSPIRRVEEA